jgi:hypothetical protein
VTLFKRPLTLLVAMAAIALLGISSNAALRPHGSISPASECRSIEIQARLDRLSQDSGFRRVATVHALQREINPDSIGGTVIPAIWTRIRFELAVRFYPQLVTQIFCETANAKIGADRIQTLPRIAALLSPLPPDDAARVGACIAIENKTISLPLASEDVASLQIDCSRRSSSWNQTFRGLPH